MNRKAGWVYSIVKQVLRCYKRPETYSHFVTQRKINTMKQLNYIVKSIPEFLSVIHEINEREDVCWYRGHKDARYFLTPNLFYIEKIT